MYKNIPNLPLVNENSFLSLAGQGGLAAPFTSRGDVTSTHTPGQTVFWSVRRIKVAAARPCRRARLVCTCKTGAEPALEAAAPQTHAYMHEPRETVRPPP